jgi:hypothetical protein
MATRTRKPKTLAQKRANPGLRSTLPDSQLTSSQLAARKYTRAKKADDTNPLYDPSKQLAGHDLAVAAQRIVDAQLKPKLAASDYAASQAKRQGEALAARVGGYYAQRAPEDTAAADRAKALAAMTNQSVAAVQGAARQDLQQASATEGARQAADASLRGGGLGGDTSTVPQTIARAQSQQDMLQPAQAALVASQGQGWAGLSNAMAQSRQMRGGEVQGELATGQQTALAKLAAERAATEGTRGDLTTEQVNKLRQGSFENLVTMKGLNIKQSDLSLQEKKIKADTAAKAAARSVSRRNTRDRLASTERGQTLSHQDRVASRQAAADQKAAADAKKRQAETSKTRVAAKKAWGGVESALAQINSGARVQKDPTDAAKGVRPATTSETIAALRAQHLPEWAVQAAVSIRHHGFLTPQVIDLIRRTAPEVRIPNQYRPPSMRKRRAQNSFAERAPGGT